MQFQQRESHPLSRQLKRLSQTVISVQPIPFSDSRIKNAISSKCTQYLVGNITRISIWKESFVLGWDFVNILGDRRTFFGKTEKGPKLRRKINTALWPRVDLTAFDLRTNDNSFLSFLFKDAWLRILT